MAVNAKIAATASTTIISIKVNPRGGRDALNVVVIAPNGSDIHRDCGRSLHPVQFDVVLHAMHHVRCSLEFPNIARNTFNSPLRESPWLWLRAHWRPRSCLACDPAR